MNAADTLVFLPGIEDLRRIFPSWPQQMRLALCLGTDGHSGFLVFRVEEGVRVLFRAAEFLELEVEDIPVVPSIAGHPSRPLMFSEEQGLLAIIAGGDAASITEAAHDYDINFGFAQEEGLDYEQLMTSAHAAPIPHDRRASPAARGSRLNFSGLQVAPSRAETALNLEEDAPRQDVALELARRMRIDAQGRVAHEPPPGFHAVKSRKRSDICRLSLVGGDTVLLRPEAGYRPDSSVTLDSLFLRDDMRALALPQDQVLDNGQIAAEIRMPADLLPTAFVARLAISDMQARLAMAGDFVQVVPDFAQPVSAAAPVAKPEIPAKAPVAPAVASMATAKARPWHARAAGRVMGGGLAAVGLSAMLAVALQAADGPKPGKAPEGAAPILDLRAKLFPDSK